MATKHLLRTSYNLRLHDHNNDEVWVYEEQAGLVVCCSTGSLGTIPWRKVRAALKRFERKGRP